MEQANRHEFNIFSVEFQARPLKFFGTKKLQGKLFEMSFGDCGGVPPSSPALFDVTISDESVSFNVKTVCGVISGAGKTTLTPVGGFSMIPRIRECFKYNPV